MNSREWLDLDGCFIFGKHQGKSVEEVWREDRNYLHWIIENVEDIDNGDREIIEMSLSWWK